MSHYTVSETQTINAPPDIVFDIIADYHDGHQQIVPRKYFEKLVVDEGGYGVGTKLTVHMNIFGNKASFKQVITEAEKGRLLVEEGDNGVVTKFVIKPLNNDTQSEVTIHTVGEVNAGIMGKIEGWLTSKLLPKIYREELANLNEVAQKWEKVAA